MRVLLEKKQANLAELTKLLSGSPQMQTVQSLLNALMEKKLVRREDLNGNFIYTATIKHADAFKSTVARNASEFTKGNFKNYIKGMISFGFLSANDLEEALEELEEGEAGEGDEK